MPSTEAPSATPPTSAPPAPPVLTSQVVGRVEARVEARVKARVEARVGFREVLGVREFRVLVGADLGSLLGDQVAAVALSILLFERTGSPLVAAAGYAITWLPALLGGPFLAALADRLPGRSVLVGTDLGRAALVGLAAWPQLPIPLLAGLVLVAALLGSPHEAARSAMQVQILEGPRYPVGSALRNTVHQVSQLAGFAVGGAAVLLLTPSGALLANAGTFLLSAGLLRLGLQARPAGLAEHQRGSLLADTLDGLRTVAADRALAWPLAIAVVGVAAAVVPEALAPAYAASLGAGPGTVGLIMASTAAGNVLGGLLLTRFAPAGGTRLVWLLAFGGMLPLVAVGPGPGLAVSLVLLTLTGMASAFQVCAQAAFALAAPPQARARVFGVAMAAISAGQAMAVLLAGALAELLAPALVIGAAGAVGAALTLCLRPTAGAGHPAARHRAGRAARRR